MKITEMKENFEDFLEINAIEFDVELMFMQLWNISG